MRFAWAWRKTKERHDFAGAMRCFSCLSADGYNHDFLAVGLIDAFSAIAEIGPITPIYIQNEKAESKISAAILSCLRLCLLSKMEIGKFSSSKDHGFFMKKITTFFEIVLLCVAGVSQADASGLSNNEKAAVKHLLDLSGQRKEEIRTQEIEAVRDLGSNCIPVLIDLVSVNAMNVNRFLAKSRDNDLQSFYDAFGDKDDAIEALVGLGLNGFDILGTNAEVAVPVLTKEFDRRGTDIGTIAIVLAAVGPTGFSVLTNALNDRNPDVRDAVIRAVGTHAGSGPQFDGQILINSLTDPNALIRLHAASFLIEKDPDLAVPALVTLLGDEDRNIRLKAASALHGRETRAVIPVLVSLLDVNDYGKGRTDFENASIYGQCLNASTALATYGHTAKGAAPKLFMVLTNVLLGTNQYLAKNLSGNLLKSLREIDPATAKRAEDFIVNNGPLGVVGYGWTDTPLPNGTELITGGLFPAEIPVKTNIVFSRSQLIETATGRRKETSPMHFSRYDHEAVLELDGKILVKGGYNQRYGNSIETNEIYDPAAASWRMDKDK